MLEISANSPVGDVELVAAQRAVRRLTNSLLHEYGRARRLTPTTPSWRRKTPDGGTPHHVMRWHQIQTTLSEIAHPGISASKDG